MYRFFIYWSLIISIYIISVCNTMINFNKNMFINFQNRRLNAVMNSASDAAITVLQEQMSINPENDVLINPNEIWSTYKKIFMNSFDMIGELDTLEFEYHTPVSMIVVDDGFYIKLPATGRINNTGSVNFDYLSPDSGDIQAYENFEYRWSPKIPFARDIRGETFKDVVFKSESGRTITKDVKFSESEMPVIVSDTVTGENILILDYNNDALKFGDIIIDADGDIVVTPSSKDYRVQPQIASMGKGFEMIITHNGERYIGQVPVHNKTFIAETLVNTSVYLMNISRDIKDNNSFYVPVQFHDDLMSSVSSFKGFALITMVQDLNLYNTGIKLTNHSISASQLVKKKHIYCYVLDGKKLYSYGRPPQGQVKTIVASPQDAAKLGYSYDFRIGG